ncbi:hypothetical protein M917_0538 [Psychrobacter aquaticus CMS 56]|uniref:Uncharacterized protein n=1 Tax=Psychrobacter aquaticus CMS 56 TaxID=1354303 RepID=U4T566_9GAMM|nr:hypothetical protein M917_0538 [Psychrobacter aquaticus CMS 56]
MPLFTGSIDESFNVIKALFNKVLTDSTVEFSTVELDITLLINNGQYPLLHIGAYFKTSDTVCRYDKGVS